MRFVLAVHGTRGDVEPCAAVGMELQRRGHEVHVFTRQGPNQSQYDCVYDVHYHRCPFALNPNFAFAHTHLGLALCFLGRSDEALAELDTAERLSPRDFQAGLNNIARAIACFIDGRYREGADFARTATRQSFDSVGAHHLVVVNSALAGDVEAAREALQTLKRFEPCLSLETLDMAVYARDEDRRRYFEAFRLSGLE